MAPAGARRSLAAPVRLFAFAIVIPLACCYSLSPIDTGSASDASKAAWTKGIGLIQAGHLEQGIRLLDSIRLSGFENESFLKDYAAHVFHAMVPERSALQSIIFDAHATDEAVLDTFACASYEWKIDRSNDAKGRPNPPCFTYGVTFTIHKPFHLVFTGLAQPNALALAPGSVENALVLKSIKDYFSQRKETAHCRLFIDFSTQKISLFDYLSPQISGKYDSVAIAPDVSDRYGISLRCYSWPRLRNDNGKFTAIASFDLPVLGLRKGPSEPVRTAGLKTVRYTLVIQSSADVRDIAEAKFQSLIRAFL